MLHTTPAKGPLPSGFIGPCLPTVAARVPDGPLWVHEITPYGYCFVCRRNRLRIFSAQRLLRRSREGICLSHHFDGDGLALYRHACAAGLEDIVSKRRDARYRSGRCDTWIKTKTPEAPAATRSSE